MGSSRGLPGQDSKLGNCAYIPMTQNNISPVTKSNRQDPESDSNLSCGEDDLREVDQGGQSPGEDDPRRGKLEEDGCPH